MVNSVPSFTDPLLLDVKAKRTTGAQACEALLNLAKVGADGRFVRTPQSEKVFQTFHNFHASWFRRKIINGEVPLSLYFPRGNFRVFDTSQPAAYFTRALFDDSFAFKQTVTSATAVDVLRDAGLPIIAMTSSEHGIMPLIYGRKPAVGLTKGTEWIIAEPFHSGVPIGFSAPSPLVLPLGAMTESPLYPNGSQPLTEVPNAEVTQSYGGGFIGSRIFLTLSISQGHNYKADGGAKLPRAWAKTLLEDFLCTEPNPVSIEQVPDEYVKPTSTVPFRKMKSCISCHAGYDQLAAVGRNVRYLLSTTYLQYSMGSSTLHSYRVPVDQPAVPAPNDAWSTAVPDDLFYRRPPTGKLMFTNYLGILQQNEVSDFSGAGTAISESDNYYLCTAKKYYRFFTGIDVDLAPKPKFEARAPSTAETFHRNQVISLGLGLKKSQNVRSLVHEILTSDVFRSRSYMTPVESED